MRTPRTKLLGIAAVLACALALLLLFLITLRDGAGGLAAEAIERLGGHVVRDPHAAGHPVVSVELGNTRVTTPT